MLHRWHQHFSKLLNQQSQFNEDVIQQMPESAPCLDLDEPPTKEELEEALSKMKRGKAGGKSRIIQERLQVIAEMFLPESQCGLRKERRCCDMIFVARQLLEKTREHHDSLFTLFVDLRKAYDSVGGTVEGAGKVWCTPKDAEDSQVLP